MEWLENFIEWVLVGLMALFGLIMLDMLGAGAFWALDNVGTSNHRTIGVVQDIHFYPAHTHLVMIGGKIPSQKVVPNEWSSLIITPVGRDWFHTDDAPKEWWDQGKTVVVFYSYGRLSGSFSINCIQDPTP